VKVKFVPFALMSVNQTIPVASEGQFELSFDVSF
jgi:hypothetical protein